MIRSHKCKIQENKFYVNAAVDAGITGTIYIGGQYSKESLFIHFSVTQKYAAVFEWADSTLQGFMKWANGAFHNVHWQFKV